MPAPDRTVVVGFIPTPEGRAAVTAAIEEAGLRGATLCVVRSYQGVEESEKESALDLRLAWADALEAKRAAGVEHRLREATGSHDPADALVSAAEEEGAQLVVIGLRRRSWGSSSWEATPSRCCCRPRALCSP